ncbi:MAG: arylformamidase [Arenicella sp.]|jgi:arylformamidase
MILKLNNQQFIDTDKPIDISIPMHDRDDAVLAWYGEPIKLEPVMTDRFIGDVNQGGAVNFRNLFMNPHVNGTHTECVGHISKEFYSINKCLTTFHFQALLISVDTEQIKNADGKEDNLITKSAVEAALKPYRDIMSDVKALVVRTLPNSEKKLSFNYSNTNPSYYTKEAIEFINELEIDHLMVDLPSIDREEDGGELIGHHTFWGYPDDVQLHKTITELIFIDSVVQDGRYIMNIQITALENDASPSKVVLYDIQS